MAQQIINTGTAPNDGTGDTLKTSFTKANANFSELYSKPAGNAFTASVSAPSSPNAGDLWFNTNVGGLNVYMNDGSSSQWVQVSPAGGTDPAPLASPVFTGNPTAPTPAIGDNDTSIATTAFAARNGNLLLSSDLGALAAAQIVIAVPTTYDLIEFDGLFFGPAAGSNIGLRMSTDGGGTFWQAANSYWTAGIYAAVASSGTTASYGANGGNSAQLNLFNNNVTPTNPGHSQIRATRLWQASPTLARMVIATNVIFDSAVNLYRNDLASVLASSTSPITHLQFFTTAGGNFGTGSFLKMYGR